MGITSSTSQAGMTEVEPAWVKTVIFPQECAQDKMGAMSDGMNVGVVPNSVIRHRFGRFDSDAARWSRGFTSGKHVFEIHFPETFWGLEASVGVGTDSAPLHAKGKVPLVGFTKDSWGISLRTKRAFHRNAMVKKYPRNQRPLPDKFYMYLDADAGHLQFGSDAGYYGTALSGLSRASPLYPMVNCTVQNACVTIVYRGEAPAPAFVGAAPVMVQTVQYGYAADGPPPPSPYNPPSYYPPNPAAAPPPNAAAVVVVAPAGGGGTSTVITSQSSSSSSTNFPPDTPQGTVDVVKA